MKNASGTRVAIVTGAGTGIGAATARRLAREGFSVTLVGRRLDRLRQLVGEIGEQALAEAADVSVPGDAATVVEQTAGRFGRIDALVNAAGTAASAAVADDTPEAWNAALATNLTGPFLMARAALPHLIERRGAIVNVSSVNAWHAGSEHASYCASKAGLITLTRSLAVDYGPKGVRANCVCPGWVRTPMADQDIDEIATLWSVDRETAYRLANSSNPLRRPAEPDDVASVIAFLTGPDAAYLNGITIPVDGGACIVDDSYHWFQGPSGSLPGSVGPASR